MLIDRAGLKRSVLWLVREGETPETPVKTHNKKTNERRNLNNLSSREISRGQRCWAGKVEDPLDSRVLALRIAGPTGELQNPKDYKYNSGGTGGLEFSVKQ